MAKRQRPDVEKQVAHVSVQRLAEAKGVSLHDEGGELRGPCPFHRGEGASLLIDATANRWTCATCSLAGGPVEWVMKAEGISRRHALELLREDNPALTKPTRGGRRSSNDGLVKHSTVPRLAAPIDAEADDQQLLQQVVAYYHQTLKQNAEALQYLQSRGLRSEEMVDRFKLGFANRTLGYRLPAKNRKAGADIRSRLTRLGILRGSGHEHFRGSLVVPILGAEGAVQQIYGRKVTPNLRAGTALHTVLHEQQRGVFNAEALGSVSSVVLCQSVIDALSFWCAGYRNVTATLGHKGFTDEFVEAFKSKGIEKVFIAYRRDADGDEAAEATAAKLMAEGLHCYRVQFPPGLDANEVVRRHTSVTDVTHALGRLLQSALWIGSGAPVAPIIDEPTDATARAADPLVAPESAPQPVSPSPAEAVTALSEPIQIEPPVPAAPDIATETKGEEVTLCFADRRYRIRGLGKSAGFEQLKVNVLVARDTGLPETGFHVDTLDLYAAKQRTAFIRQASHELAVSEEVIRHDLGRVLFKLEELQEAMSQRATAATAPKQVALTDAETVAAMDLLKAPDLFDRILRDFDRCGVVGEEANKLMGYLAVVSRKLDEPLAIIVQSTSAAGKTSLLDAVLAFVPEEDRVKYSAVTGQSLFYMGETGLRHKVLAISEEEGASRAAYALKLLQSEGELTIASTGKEASTGRLVSHEYRVRGPVMLFLTTTAIDLDDELLNRCVVLTVDEDREQTRSIHRLQRERQTLAGFVARRDREALLAIHRNAQRLLKPLPVINPYALHLTFLDDRTRTRRDHMKYLGLIKAIALLRQHQRELKTTTVHGETVQYIEVQPDDIAIANRLADAILGRSLDDVPAHTRKLLVRIDEFVTSQCKAHAVQRSDFRFNRRRLREETGWGDTQLKVHLRRLVEMEYLLVHRAEAGRGHLYELVWDGRGQRGGSILPGLIEPGALQRYDSERSASEPARAGVGRPVVGAQSGGGRPNESDSSTSGGADLAGSVRADPSPSHAGPVSSDASYSNGHQEGEG